MDKTIRILLVDGYAVMRDALRALIATAPDMEVIGEAVDSTGAVEQALLLQPEVVILDLLTLGGNGMTAVASLMKDLPQTRILVLTNEINKREISAAIDAGVKGYLLKGTSAPEILDAIRGLHRDELIIDPSVTNALL